MHVHRFALPHKLQLLGVPAGQHIKVRVAGASGSALEQAFTPISTDDNPGEVMLLVKVTPLFCLPAPHAIIPICCWLASRAWASQASLGRAGTAWNIAAGVNSKLLCMGTASCECCCAWRQLRGAVLRRVASGVVHGVSCMRVVLRRVAT